MPFLLKQHDLKPRLNFQFFQPDGTTPLNLTTATSVSIVLKMKGGSFIAKRAVTIQTPATGICYYDWTLTDTDVAGTLQYEFEIIWNDGDPQTVPVDTYLEATITADLG